MTQAWIDIDDNDNCGYFPMQTFEMRGTPESGTSVIVEDLHGKAGPHEITGWCSNGGGTPCEVSVVLIGDSGAGESLLVYGGDNGIRIRPLDMVEPWSLQSLDQRGEPYILLASDTAYQLKT